MAELAGEGSSKQTTPLAPEDADDIVMRASPTLAALGIRTKEVAVLLFMPLLLWFSTS